MPQSFLAPSPSSNGLVLMVESICGQGFTCARKVEEERQKKLVKTRVKDYREKHRRLNQLGQKLTVPSASLLLPFIGVRCIVRSKSVLVALAWKANRHRLGAGSI
jgi:hypothetical protein